MNATQDTLARAISNLGAIEVDSFDSMSVAQPKLYVFEFAGRWYSSDLIGFDPLQPLVDYIAEVKAPRLPWWFRPGQQTMLRVYDTLKATWVLVADDGCDYSNFGTVKRVTVNFQTGEEVEA